MSDTTLTPEKLFHSHPCFETSPEVWAVIFARHKEDLEVTSTFSDPSGTFMGGPGEVGRMETCYHLRGADFPLLGARTTWDIGEKPHDKRRHQYFIFIARNEADE